MGDKIISIITGIFLLIMSISLMVMLQFVQIKNDLDLNLDRVNNSVLTANGEIKDDSYVDVTGASLYTSIKYKEKIDSKRALLGQAVIYGNSSNNYTGYSIIYNGEIITSENVSDKIDIDLTYLLNYDLKNKVITIERG